MLMNRPVITVLGLCGRSVFMKVDHFHNSGETLHADFIHVEPGGKGYNQAVAAARLGAKVYFFAACGDDDDGRGCEEFLEKEGIVPYIQKVDGSTAFATILTDQAGNNQVTVFRGATDNLSGEFIRAHEMVFAESDIVLLNFEVPEEANEAAIALSEKYGVKIIMNPAPAHPCCRAYLERFFCITPNESEAETIGFETEREVITLGSDGVLVIDGTDRKHLPALKVEVKDTTGAGDCFNGAFAVSIGEGNCLLEAARFAQRAASYSVSLDFVMPSLPYRIQID